MADTFTMDQIQSIINDHNVKLHLTNDEEMKKKIIQKVQYYQDILDGMKATKKDE